MSVPTTERLPPTRAVAARAAASAALDPVLVGLVSMVVYALHGYDGVLDRDLGAFVYGGEQFARGVPPYVGQFNSVGPLADAVPGLAIWCGNLVGLDPVLAARICFTLLSGGCCALVAVLARDALESRAAGFVAAGVFLTFQKFIDLASNGPREKTTMVLFLVGVLIFTTRRRWLAAGVCTALATLTWQPALAVAVGAVVAAIVLGEERRGRACVRFLVGGVIPSVVTVAYFAGQHALQRAFDGFVLVNVLYTSQPSALFHASYAWHLLWSGYHVGLPLVIVGLGLLIGAGVIRFRRLLRGRTLGSRPRPGDVALVGVAVGAVVGTVWTLQAINGSPDLFELLPFGALGVAWGVLWLTSRLAARQTLVIASVVLALVVAAGTSSVLGRNHLLDLERLDVQRVLAAAPPGADVLSISAPEVPAIADRTNPVPVQIFDIPIESFLDRTWPGGLTGYADHIASLRPTLIAVSRTYDGIWPDAMLEQDYWLVGKAPLWYWYVSRSVGLAQLAALRAANASVAIVPRNNRFQ